MSNPDIHHHTKRIAALTMVRNDAFFLQKWVEYYSRQLEADNLYVLIDGEDQQLPQGCDGVHFIVKPRSQGNVRQGDKARIRLVSEQALALFDCGYDAVIGTDVDEFVVPDPVLGLSLAQVIDQLPPTLSAASALGIDVGQDTRTEGPVSPTQPMLGQRHAAKLSTRYTKASIMLRPGQWGSGFHRQQGRNLHIIPGLYLFHFGCVDADMVRQKMGNPDLNQRGWSRHLAKRMRTITLCSTHTARPFDRWTRFARLVQTFVRPPYAWNKPAMFELNIIVELPSRFKHLV